MDQASGGITGRLDRLREDCASAPGDPAAWSRLGNFCLSLGALEEGLQALERSIGLDEYSGPVWSTYASALGFLKKFPEALAAYDRAIGLSPNDAEAHNNRGVVLEALGRKEDALAAYDRAAEVKPSFAEAHYNRGNLLLSLARYDEALAAYDRAVALRPAYAQALNNRANALRVLGRNEEALEGYTQAAAAQKGYVRALLNRATLLLEMGRPGEAAEAYAGVIEVQGDHAEAHLGRGNALREALRLDEALQSYDRALALRADYPEASWNKGLILLLKGEYTEGWRLYEYRWRTTQSLDVRSFDRPLWLGGVPLRGKTILVHAEQGFGDTILACRYVPLLVDEGARVVLEAPPALHALLSGLPGVAALLRRGDALPPFDFQVPLMSLMLAFGTTPETVPSIVPYLQPDPVKVAAWRSLLGARRRPRIGLAWRGRSDHKNDRARSLSPAALAPLLALPFEFHSLQREYREGDRASLASFVEVADHAEDLRDFSDTAALIAAMDAVVSVDTAVAHLSGALGRDTRLLLPRLPDYRWGLDGAKTPWYPTARLYRQQQAGAWDPVVKRLASELAASFA